MKMKRIVISLWALTALVMPLTGAFAKKASALEGVVNINSASVEELSQLPGIGKSKAETIIAYRQAHPFKAVSELTEVKGIGQKMFEKLQKYLVIDGLTTLKEASLVPQAPAVPAASVAAVKK